MAATGLHQVRGASALRQEKRASGARLTMAAPAWVLQTPDGNQVDGWKLRATVSKPRLRRWGRLPRMFRADAAGWPHRAANLTHPGRVALNRAAQLSTSASKLRVEGEELT
jgi:hypothetical protein